MEIYNVIVVSNCYICGEDIKFVSNNLKFCDTIHLFEALINLSQLDHFFYTNKSLISLN